MVKFESKYEQEHIIHLFLCYVVTYDPWSTENGRLHPKDKGQEDAAFFDKAPQGWQSDFLGTEKQR